MSFLRIMQLSVRSFGRRQRAQHVLYLIWGLLTDEQLYWQWIIWSSSCYSWDHGSGDN